MNRIGSIMAEQADKIKKDSLQDKALYQASLVIHDPTAQDCRF